jgi:hypothetical protein
MITFTFRMLACFALDAFCLLPVADALSPVLPSYHSRLSDCAVCGKDSGCLGPSAMAEINRECDRGVPGSPSDGSGSIAFAGMAAQKNG